MAATRHAFDTVSFPNSLLHDRQHLEMLPRKSSIAALETKSVLCVKAEIHNVLTSLRHGSDSRWSSKRRFEHEIPLKEEHTLLRAFKELHFYLEEFDDLRDVDTVEYLRPFLQVVTSEYTNASITMVALRSLNKFLLYDFISAESPRVKQAMNDMAHALTRCRRFNERVLMQLMQVSELVVRNPAGRFLTDDHICELFKVCYRVCRSLDASILLRQSAESTLSHIIITVFGRVTGGTDDNLTKIDPYDKKKASGSSTALRLETALGQTNFLKDVNSATGEETSQQNSQANDDVGIRTIGEELLENSDNCCRWVDLVPQGMSTQ